MTLLLAQAELYCDFAVLVGSMDRITCSIRDCDPYSDLTDQQRSWQQPLVLALGQSLHATPARLGLLHRHVAAASSMYTAQRDVQETNQNRLDSRTKVRKLVCLRMAPRDTKLPGRQSGTGTLIDAAASDCA